MFHVVRITRSGRLCYIVSRSDNFLPILKDTRIECRSAVDCGLALPTTCTHSARKQPRSRRLIQSRTPLVIVVAAFDDCIELVTEGTRSDPHVYSGATEVRQLHVSLVARTQVVSEQTQAEDVYARSPSVFAQHQVLFKMLQRYVGCLYAGQS